MADSPLNFEFERGPKSWRHAMIVDCNKLTAKETQNPFHEVASTQGVVFVALTSEFNNLTSLIAIAALVAHAVVREGLINVFWSRESPTNNSIQPRGANGVEGRAEAFQTMGPLNVSFAKSAALVLRMFSRLKHRFCNVETCHWPEKLQKKIPDAKSLPLFFCQILFSTFSPFP